MSEPRLRLMTKEQAEGLEITMQGIGVSLATLIEEVGTLRQQESGEGSEPVSGLVGVVERDLREWRQLQGQLVAILAHVRKRPLDWRTALGIFLLGLLLGSAGAFWWTLYYAPVTYVQPAPAARGR